MGNMSKGKRIKKQKAKAEQRQPQPPICKPHLPPQQIDICIGALSEVALPMRLTLPIVNELNRAKREALIVKPKTAQARKKK
jgi:hypothetical protein